MDDSYLTDLQTLLVRHEGLRLTPYQDTVGKWTIGVGRNLDDKGISTDEAIMLLDRDIADAIDDVNHVCSCYDALSRPRQLVLVSMAFNMGRDRLGKFVRFLGAIHRGDWEDAADEMVQSAWYKQVGLRGKQLERMMRSDVSAWV